MSTRNNNAKTTKPKLYPVAFKGETRYVTVPGSGDLQPGPDSEAKFETFLAEAIEAYAEASEISRPQIRRFVEAGAKRANHGLIVRIGDAEFQVTMVKSR